MKKITALLLAFSLLAFAASACTPGATQQPSLSEADIQATVNAGIQATQNAQANMQATVDAAVVATQQAATPAPTQTPSVEYVTLTEEELAALIDQAVAEAIAASEQTTTATGEATADDSLTQQEAETLETYVTVSEETIAYAEEVITAYDELYGDYASAALDELAEIEEDLESLAQSTAEIAAVLDEINTTLQQGLTLAEETINELEAAAQKASQQAAEAKAQAQGWAEKVKTELDARTAKALSMAPDQIPGDRQAAVQSLFTYVDTLKSAMTDGKFSALEMDSIARAGANAKVGLQQHGGSQLQGLSGMIDGLTTNVARGQLPQLQAGLGGFEASLPARPGRP